jgi:transposase, IS30 family
MVRLAMPRELERGFWLLIGLGWSTRRAALEVGVSTGTGERWFLNGGGMAPISLVEPGGRYLSLAEREVLDLCWAEGWTQAEIGRELGRSPSTISRELRRNRLLAHPKKPPLPDGRRRRPGPVPGSQGPGRRPRPLYRAAPAQAKAEHRSRRPKPAKLVVHAPLRNWVQGRLAEEWSPEQIARRLPEAFPDDERMRISHEAIYQSLFVQGRGALRRELTVCLRTGRTLRKPRRRAEGRRERIKDKVMLSERPAEADDRAVPGHWEGDLIVGEDSGSAIGTLVERSTRFVVLLHLPGPHDPLAFHDAVVEAMTALPAQLRRSLAWDQGLEMRNHKQISIAADLPIYFCDPHSPWQRGTNENTNGLLRQYLPKGTDLSKQTPADLAEIARSLNGRPRKTLGWLKPIEVIGPLLSGDQPAGVASAP